MTDGIIHVLGRSLRQGHKISEWPACANGAWNSAGVEELIVVLRHRVNNKDASEVSFQLMSAKSSLKHTKVC